MEYPSWSSFKLRWQTLPPRPVQYSASQSTHIAQPTRRVSQIHAQVHWTRAWDISLRVRRDTNRKEERRRARNARVTEKRRWEKKVFVGRRKRSGWASWEYKNKGRGEAKRHWQWERDRTGEERRNKGKQRSEEKNSKKTGKLQRKKQHQRKNWSRQILAGLGGVTPQTERISKRRRKL